MPDKKDVKRLIDEAKSWTGWRVEQRTKGWFLYAPDKRVPPIAIHNTPSDHRTWQNMLSRLRRAGAPI